jgi:hypothetical protein
MKKVLLGLVLVLGTLVSKAQFPKVNAQLENGKGIKQLISFELWGKPKIDSLLGNNSSKKIQNCLIVANIELKCSMKFPLSYSPIQTKDNNIMVFDEKIAIRLSTLGKNSYGNELEKSYTILLKSDDYSDISKIKVDMVF